MKKFSFVGALEWLLPARNVNRVRGLLWNNPLTQYEKIIAWNGVTEYYSIFKETLKKYFRRSD
jgi:hypothetical protein